MKTQDSIGAAMVIRAGRDPDICTAADFRARLRDAAGSGKARDQAAALAQALRSRGLVAEAPVAADGTACVLIISSSSARLAEQVCVRPHQGAPWFWRSGEPLCPAGDIGTAAAVIAARI